MGDLGRRLWAVIEEPQGSAFVGDDVQLLGDDAVLRIAQAALAHTNRTARILRTFLRDAASRLPPKENET